MSNEQEQEGFSAAKSTSKNLGAVGSESRQRAALERLSRRDTPGLSDANSSPVKSYAKHAL